MKIKDQMDPRKAYERALYLGCGYTYDDLEKPRIAIVNSWNEINPGHIHLRKLAKYVKEGIKEAGGTIELEAEIEEEIEEQLEGQT